MIPTIADLEHVFSSVVSVAISIGGIAFTIMLIAGGFQYLMAGGDKEGAAKARNTLTYALIGLAVTVSAWMILFLLGYFLGVDFGTFSLCVDGSGCGKSP